MFLLLFSLFQSTFIAWRRQPGNERWEGRERGPTKQNEEEGLFLTRDVLWHLLLFLLSLHASIVRVRFQHGVCVCVWWDLNLAIATFVA